MIIAIEKNKAGKRDGSAGSGGGWGIVTCERGGLLKKLSFLHTPKGGEGTGR